MLCRGRDVPPPHITRAIEPAPAPTPIPAPRPTPRPTPLSLGLAGEYYVDDVCLSQRGAHHMKLLEAEMGITHTRRKRRFKNENTDKDAGKRNGFQLALISMGCFGLGFFTMHMSSYTTFMHVSLCGTKKIAKMAYQNKGVCTLNWIEKISEGCMILFLVGSI